LPVVLSVDEVWRILSHLDHPSTMRALPPSTPVACVSVRALTSCELYPRLYDACPSAALLHCPGEHRVRATGCFGAA
jgi:hypothetical protein